MDARKARAGGRFLADERGSYSEGEVIDTPRPWEVRTAPLVEFLSLKSLSVLAEITGLSIFELTGRQ